MKVITEAILRDELRASKPECYIIPADKILSPAAREYLQQLKVKIVTEKKLVHQGAAMPTEEGSQKEMRGDGVDKTPKQAVVTPVPKSSEEETETAYGGKPKYEDYETGALYYEKPEFMTQLTGNKLVVKNHNRILFRGKLDSLEATFVLYQNMLKAEGASEALVNDLEDVLVCMRDMMRADVLDEPLTRETMIGLTHEELREHSHNPMKFYAVKQMVLPHHTLGMTYALLNKLRTEVRETEVAACTAFAKGKTYERVDILQELNRMSSAMHIIMCRLMAGNYDD